MALYRPVCLCEWLQWMGFRRNILDNIYGLSNVIYKKIKQTGAEYAKEPVRGKNYFCAIATRGQTQTEQYLPLLAQAIHFIGPVS